MFTRTQLIRIFACIFAVALFSGCHRYRDLITDEVILKDRNSHTGTIEESDSESIKLRKIDESVKIIPWSQVDTVVGKKYKTFWAGANFGFYKTPYFSVFRNEAINAHSAGFQYKAGWALRGTNLYYFSLLFLPASPYKITKTGFGYQHYIFKTSYLKMNSYFWGGEINAMNAKHNNGFQLTLEPFFGAERKLTEQLRGHLKFQLQLNLANKNNAAGSSITVGIHFLQKSFTRRYTYLNKEHRIYKK